MYFNYFKKLEKKYFLELSNSKPVVIRFDGKNITKSQKYNLSFENAFTTALLKTTKKLVNRFDGCLAYVAMDEVSFIFKDLNILKNHYVKDTQSLQYFISMFQQEFVSIFWKHIPNIYFGVTIFCIPENKEKSYIAYRKSVCRNTSVVYFAKRNKDYNIPYRSKPIKEILTEIKNLHLDSELTRFPHFMNGTIVKNDFEENLEKQSKEPSVFDTFDFV